MNDSMTSQLANESRVLLDLTRTLISSHDIHEILFKVVSTIAHELQVDRCSIILTRRERDYGFVIVSSDDRDIFDLPIDLSRYPEIIEVIEQRRPIVIEDLRTSPLLEEVKESLAEAGFSSSALFPIALEEQTMGVIFLRFAKIRQNFGPREINFCETVANATAIALRNAEIVEKLRERTREIESAQIHTERQLIMLRRYEDFFINSVDGMLVTNRDDKILYANPRAASLTGRTVSSLKNASFHPLFLKEEENRLTAIQESMYRGETPRQVDVRGYGPRGEERFFSISATSLSGMEHTFLWTLRDVTETRKTEEELVRAQRSLIETEKKTAVMELAGAAAHELNQPIQSMIAAIGLLQKMTIQDDKIGRTIGTIAEELDRLADIVRKISRITRYETKAYLGKTQILDLEKSTGIVQASSVMEPPEWIHHIPLPCFFADPDGKLLIANAGFGRILPFEQYLGRPFAEAVDLTGDAQVWPSLSFLTEAPAFPVKIRNERFTLHLAAYGKAYCGFLVPASIPVHAPPLLDAVCAGDLDTAVNERLLSSFIYLAKELNVMMREEELIFLFANTFQTLLPGRLVCIRLIDPESIELSLVYANGRLRADRRGRLELDQSTIEGQALSCDESERTSLSKIGIPVTAMYSPIFEKGRSGFSVPLFDATHLFGLINVEYGEPRAEFDLDKMLAVPLARQMTWAVRNAKLVADSTYLRDYLEKLLDNANALVMVVDRNRKIEVVNKVVEELTGFDRNELLGRSIDWLVGDEGIQRLSPVVSNALRGESMRNIEVALPRSDGGDITIAFNTAPILGGFGEIEGIVFIGQDLTEIQKLQEQVIHSEKLATLGQLAAGVVHELNNPLTSITVYSNYLLKKLTDSGADESDLSKIQRILEGAERILQFTKALVAYARPSSAAPTSISVKELAVRASSFCDHLVAKARATVEIKIPEGIKNILGVEDQLQQVLVNLITNACHAIPASGGCITIEAEELDDGRIHLIIADNGHGIRPEILDQIFEPFFTTKPVGVGTGLGLSIVRNIIRNHQGDITVESALDRGTTFHIYLVPSS